MRGMQGRSGANASRSTADEELTQVVAAHFRPQFHLAEDVTIAHNHHHRQDYHIPQMHLCHLRLHRYFSRQCCFHPLVQYRHC